MKRVGWIAAALVTVAVGGDAIAQGPTVFDPARLHVSLGEDGVLALPGEAVVSYGRIGAIGITSTDPAARDRIGDEDTLIGVLRLAPRLTFTNAGWRPFAFIQLGVDLDVLRNVIVTSDDRELLAEDPASRVEPSRVGGVLGQAFIDLIGPGYGIKAGLVRSSWGVGMLAGDGAQRGPDSDASPFGVALWSDRVVRLQLAVFPIAPASRPVAGREDWGPPLTIALAVDGVIEDDTARWSDGDRAYHGIAAVRGHAGPVLAGLYAVHRRQSHAGGGETVVTVLDLHTRVELARTRAMLAWLEVEGALILGNTTYSRSAIHDGAFDVTAMGGLMRFGVRSGRWTALLEAGAASGDDNPYDDEVTAFSFDNEHRVGLIMFREALRTATAITASNIADPAYRGVPPRGYERIATGGAVRGAAYINPRLTWRALDDLYLYSGFLWAATDGDYVDAYRGGLEGGAPVGPNGAWAADELGWEIDLGIRWAIPLEHVKLHLRLEGGYFAPGEVFDRGEQAMDDVFAGWIELGAQW